MIHCTFLEVTDKELLDKVFAFRYKVFMEIYPKYIGQLGITDAKEHDKYDPYAIHFAALDEDGEVCATVRLIYHSPLGYPTENSTQFDNSMFERDKLGEMSRIFVDAHYRDMKTTKIIINEFKKLAYLKMMKIGVEYSYGYLEENFLRLLKIYKMPYHPIGEKQKHQEFGVRYPCILYTEELGTANPEFIQLWEQKKYEI